MCHQLGSNEFSLCYEPSHLRVSKVIMSDFDASSLSSYVSTSEANTTASDGDCWKACGDMCAECGRAWKWDCPLCQVCRDSGAGAFLDVPIVGWFGEGVATVVAEKLFFRECSQLRDIWDDVF